MLQRLPALRKVLHFRWWIELFGNHADHGPSELPVKDYSKSLPMEWELSSIEVLVRWQHSSYDTILLFAGSVWVVKSSTCDSYSRERVSFLLIFCGGTWQNRAYPARDHFELFLQENLNKTGLGSSTRVPISNKIGGAEITASF